MRHYVQLFHVMKSYGARLVPRLFPLCRLTKVTRPTKESLNDKSGCNLFLVNWSPRQRLAVAHYCLCDYELKIVDGSNGNQISISGWIW